MFHQNNLCDTLMFSRPKSDDFVQGQPDTHAKIGFTFLREKVKFRLFCPFRSSEAGCLVAHLRVPHGVVLIVIACFPHGVSSNSGQRNPIGLFWCHKGETELLGFELAPTSSSAVMTIIQIGSGCESEETIGEH